MIAFAGCLMAPQAVGLSHYNECGSWQCSMKAWRIFVKMRRMTLRVWSGWVFVW